MLLFSTVLDVIDSLNADEFIRLVLEWNEGSMYATNKVTGINWHGEHCVKYGDRTHRGCISVVSLSCLPLSHYH